MAKITVVDSIMGSGKTSWSIQKMKNDKENNYIYITPYLSEVERIKKSCIEKRFVEPKHNGKGKQYNFHELILQDKNIASTHALFRASNNTTINLINNSNYILILDEVMDVVEQIHLRKDDVPLLLSNNLIFVDDDFHVRWNDEKKDFDSSYNELKDAIETGHVFMVNGCLLMWTFPIEIFDAFKEVYVLTYLFDGQIQKSYYDLYNVDYEYKSVKETEFGFELCDYIKEYNMSKIKSLITIVDDEKLNKIGNYTYSFSKRWFSRLEQDEFKQLKNNIYNFYRNKTNGKSSDAMWTTYKDYKQQLSGKGYTKGFVSLGTRATNDYVNKRNLAYCSNVYFNPMIKHFFNNKNISPNEDMFALSELIQWIWRSRIRENEQITVYIPNNRMRNLFVNWLG